MSEECCTIDLRLGPASPIVLNLASSPIELELAGSQIDLELNASPIDLELNATPINLTLSGTGVQGPPGLGVQTIVKVRWDAPFTQVGDTIEIVGDVLDSDGNPLLSNIVDVHVTVSDGANDAEPSSTATITAATVPVGTILAGSGTATIIIRSGLGQIKIAVHESNPSHRFLWLHGSGQERLLVIAADGVQELIFT